MEGNLSFGTKENKMQILLEKVGVINLRHEKLKDEHEFNIFSILRAKGDEVNVHSNFIHELLNPTGSHRKTTEFLTKFLEIAEIEGFDINGVQLKKERDKIDILIHNRTQAIIIENKIWAEDQPKQLERYYKKIKKRGFSQIWLIYLTLYGDPPSEASIGDLPEDIKDKYLLTLSYSFQISKWIEACIAICSLQPILRETLLQYKYLIEELTGRSMSNDQTKELIELLSKSDNILKAHTIAENWIHVKWHVELYFWEDFEEIIKKEYEILPTQKYSSSSLDNVVHKNRNRDPWFGIMIELFKNGEDRFCLFIERGWDDIYYGITILDNKGRSEDKHAAYENVAKQLNEYSEWEKEDFWLGGNWLSPRINFEAFSEDATLMLLNKDYRRKFLEKNWQEIKEFINKFEKIKKIRNEE